MRKATMTIPCFLRRYMAFASSATAVGALWACGADDATHAADSLPPTASADAAGLPTPVGSGSDAAGAPQSTPGTPVVTQVEGSGATCQQVSIDSGRVVPDVLIVLDRSTSMLGFGVDRWTPSVAAIKAITRELDQVIRFGLMAFPGRGTATGGGLDALLGGGMSCAAGSLEVPLGIGMAGAIGASLDALQLIQSTPTAATLEAAHMVLGTGTSALDGTTAAKIVVLVTDGAPNCSDDPLAFLANDAAAVADSVNAIAAMQRDGIKTFVVGYDTQSDPTLKTALDQMAQAGGTGDKEHRPIENEAGLVMQLHSIIGAALSCQFTLAKAPTDPNYVSVTIDASKLSLDAPDGFVLSDDRMVLTLQGAACTQVQNESERHLVTVRVECERQTPLL
jgi:hypothetical protein